MQRATRDYGHCSFTGPELVQTFTDLVKWVELGVKPGDKVALMLPNTPHFVICYYAILKAGGTVVNYSPLYSEPELKHQIEDSDTDIMVTLGLQLLGAFRTAMRNDSECIVIWGIREWEQWATDRDLPLVEIHHA